MSSADPNERSTAISAPAASDTGEVHAAKIPMIIDCDPGHDDAVAIVTAAHVADVRGIVTVAGNAPLDRTTHNALVMRDLLQLDAPVHSGIARPLVNEPFHAAYVHGESGLDGAELPEPTTPLDGTDGVEFIIETCRADEGIWLVPIGPLTNIATAFRLAPDLPHRIAGVSLMGGGSYGNSTAAAEFNLWCDPHAAAIVFDAFDRSRSGTGSGTGAGTGPLIMAGLDVTHRFQVTPERIEQTRELPGRVAGLLADLFVFFSDAYLSWHDTGTMSGAALHDPLAVLAITHPELFTREHRHVAVETQGALTAGMTVIDKRTLTSRKEPNCDVLVDVDHEAAFAVVLDAIAACP